MPFDPNTADNTPAGFIPSLFGQPSPVQQQGGGTALGMAEDPFPQPGGGGGIVSGRGQAPTSRPSAPAPTPSAPAPSAPAPSASAAAPPKPPNPSGSFNDMIGADSGVGSGGATTSSGSFNDFIGARAGHGANFSGGNMGHGPVMGLADGGAIPDGDEDDIDPMSSLPESDHVDDRRTDNAFGVDTPTSKKTIGMWASGVDTSGTGQDENSGGGALSVVDRVLQYGRQMHGLLGGQDQNDGVVPKQQMGFDDGGAVPDGDDENNIGLQDEQQDAPAQGDSETSMGLGDDQQPQQAQQDDGGPQGGPIRDLLGGRSPGQALRSGGQQVLRYLMGATAAPPDQVKALEQQVDPQNQMDPNEKVPQVIASAAEQGGDDAGFNTLQHYRKKYDASKSFAAAALLQGNMASATHAATQAFTNVPDGQSVRFTEDTPGSVTATVTEGGKPVMQSQLTTQQFAQLLRKDGQFDNILAKGMPAVLSQMLKQAGGGVSVDGSAQGSAQAGPQAPQAPQVQAPQAPQAPQPGARPAPRQDARDEIERTADRVYGTNPFGGYVPQDQRLARQKYIDTQRAQQQKMDIDRTKANNPLGVAQIRGASGVQREQVKQEGAKDVANTRAIAYTDKNTKQIALGLAKIAASTANENVKNQIPVLRQYLAGRPLGQPADPKMDEAIHRLMDGLHVQLEQGPAPQQGQQPQQPQRQGAAPAAPQGAFKPPAGWVFSPSRKQYRDQQGIIYDQNGNRVQ